MDGTADSTLKSSVTIGNYYIQRKLLNMLSDLPKPPLPAALSRSRVTADIPPPVPVRRGSHPCLPTPKTQLWSNPTSPLIPKHGNRAMCGSVTGMPTPSSPQRTSERRRLPALFMPPSPHVSRRVMKSPLPVRYAGAKPPLPVVPGIN